MDDRTVNKSLVEVSLRHAREQRLDMALWLAVEILMTDDMALADDALQERLLLLQDRVEDKVRTQYGVGGRLPILDGECPPPRE